MHIDDSQMIVEGSNSHLRINAAPIIVSRYRLSIQMKGVYYIVPNAALRDARRCSQLTESMPTWLPQ
jgi:hypothetical protein